MPINLAEVFYDAIESDLEDIEIRIKRKLIEALKENAMSDNQINEIINSIHN